MFSAAMKSSISSTSPMKMFIYTVLLSTILCEKEIMVEGANLNLVSGEDFQTLDAEFLVRLDSAISSEETPREAAPVILSEANPEGEPHETRPTRLARNVCKPQPNQHGECAICLENFADTPDIATLECGHSHPEKPTIATLECGHEFHEECINKWSKKSNTCPLCRHKEGSRRVTFSEKIAKHVNENQLFYAVCIPFACVGLQILSTRCVLDAFGYQNKSVFELEPPIGGFSPI